jgi:5-methylcytosine-specific restriction endonuclease McrA
MAARMEPTRLTRRERELRERPNCAVCGIKVVRKTSDLIDGKLWCLSCCRGPSKTQRKRRKLRQQRRFLFDAHPFCVYCGCELQWESSTVDHVVPLSKGGTHDLENLVLACEPCNTRKGSKILAQETWEHKCLQSGHLQSLEFPGQRLKSLIFHLKRPISGRAGF